MNIAVNRFVTAVGTGVLAVLAVLAVAGAADAQSTTTGPTVVLAADELAPADRLDFQLEGFDGAAVIITVCGNDARRGSVDCNMIASEGLRLNRQGGITQSSIPVPVPPTPCPCLVQVVDSDRNQLAVAPLIIIGHPVAPTVGPAGFVQPLVVEIIAEQADVGISERLRSSAAGATFYDVTVTVRNRSTLPVDRVQLSGSGGRDANDDLVVLGLDDPGTIQPGQTWEETTQAELPSPVWGDYVWQATASGTGPSVMATTTSTHRPWLLIVLIVVLIVDLLILAVRLIMHLRRRAEAADAGEFDNPFIDGPDGGGGDWEAQAIATHEGHRVPQPVG